MPPTYLQSSNTQNENGSLFSEKLLWIKSSKSSSENTNLIFHQYFVNVSWELSNFVGLTHSKHLFIQQSTEVALQRCS